MGQPRRRRCYIHGSMASPDERLYRALASRDARFDGRFFACVRTTGVYGRPICSARTPKRENVLFVPTAAAAEAAGFRPCRRCRPETAPGSPAWVGTPGVVSRALRLVEAGFLDRGDVPGLAERLGVGERQLRRLVRQHFGAPLLAIAQAHRVHFARRLVDETDLPMSEIAFASGFGSVRGFDQAVRKTFGRPPSELRRRRRAQAVPVPGVTLRLAYRPPLDWDRLLAFLAPRATPGVEVVARGVYGRTIRFQDRIGTIAVRRVDGRHLAATVDLPPGPGLPAVVERIRRTFDLGADPLAIVPHLRRDPALRAALGTRRDVRVPGAWDGFELAVRAVLGQQVTVRGATTLAGRLVERFGRSRDDAAGPGLDRLFPTPVDLAEAPVETIGVPGARADALRAVARATRDDADLFDPGRDVARTVRRLRALPGIGDWTAQYVAMRVLRDSDAFPAGDLALRRILGNGAPLRERELLARAEAWRPWRSYAAMAIWGGEPG